MILPAIGLGVIYAVLCELVAFVMLGAGHGWMTPFRYGVIGFALFPFCFWCAFTAEQSSRRLRLLAGFAFCLVANFAVLFAAKTEGMGYFDKVVPFGHFWIVLWLGGQMVPLCWVAINRATR